MNEINCRVPVITMRGLVMMPGMTLKFDISRPRSIAAVEEAMRKDQLIWLTAQKDPQVEEPGIRDFMKVGVLSKIKRTVKQTDETVQVSVKGLMRATLDEVISEHPYILADVIATEDLDAPPSEPEQDAMCRELESLISSYEEVGTTFSQEIHHELDCDSRDIRKVTRQLAHSLPMRWQDRQHLLEAEGFRELFIRLCQLLDREFEVLSINLEIQQKVKDRLEKNQREYVLREHMKMIQQELGEDVENEADEYQKKLEDLEAPDYVKEKLAKEISRFRSINMNSAESSVYRNYIDTVFEIPWSAESEDNRDMNKAEKILREDHYGLEKVKERILEYLSVRLLSQKGSPAILCLVGPPGTGKTSIARSVARALDKKYVRMSLGGVHDEAEIRGHRKTYIGAMPGRIAGALRQAGVRNPVLLLDEIDKVGVDYKGDTFSALLEVLDPEQNCNFRDNYLEMPLDLSDVLFIATANSLHTVPQPLLDRMEVIEINTYTQNEKFHIAKEHLVAKQLQMHGLKKSQLSITDSAIEAIILYYTREAGVRNLERCIGDLCRKTARILLQQEKKKVSVTARNLESFLGPKKYEFDKKNKSDEIGIARGLAWTSVGGDTLSIEVNVMPGKGKFELTGQLGDVMKESAMAGISYIRSVSDRYGIAADFFDTHDIHIHIPEGAVPKDGPSAGVTMVTAMLSAITGQPVRADVAMTGEVTLRGRVLPIGGLREKTIAAKLAGIDTVIVPEKNKPDIGELSNEITDGMHFVYAGSMDDILPVAFAGTESAAGHHGA